MGWGGVQIGNLGRIGRYWVVGVASRLGIYGGLDATYGLGRRPGWSCMAKWTPLTGWHGVQVGVVWRNGRHLRAGTASKSLVVADLGSRADWTPLQSV